MMKFLFVLAGALLLMCTQLFAANGSVRIDSASISEDGGSINVNVEYILTSDDQPEAKTTYYTDGCYKQVVAPVYPQGGSCNDQLYAYFKRDSELSGNFNRIEVEKYWCPGGVDDLGMLKAHSDTLKVPAGYSGGEELTATYYLEDVAGYGCQLRYGRIYSVSWSIHPDYQDEIASATATFKLCEDGASFCCVDADGDGFYAIAGSCEEGSDCDDSDPEVNPGAEDVCDDGIDNNCNGQVDESCCPTIQSVDVASVELDASGEGEITVAYEIDGDYDSVTVSANGKELDGPGHLGDEFREGSNLVTVTVKKEGCDDVQSSVQVNIVQTEDCKYVVSLASKVNLATGELTDSFDLFSATGLGFRLSYHSLDGNTGPLGLNWSHNYNIYLVEDDFGAVAVRDGDGNWLLYSLSGESYSSGPGNHSILSKDSAGHFVLRKLNGTVYIFDDSKKISSIVDRNGKSLTFGYSDNLLDRVSDSYGRSITLEYALGKLISITDPAGNIYSVGVGNALERITYPDGSRWQFSYQEHGFMTEKVDPAGNLTSYDYDGQQRVVGATDPQGRSRSIAYADTNDALRTTAFTEKDGSIWLYSYDSQLDKLVSKTDPQGNVTSYSYDGNRNLIAKTEPGVGTSTFTYDASGNMLSRTDAGGNMTSYTYNEHGLITSTTNASGEVTAYNYDSRGNLIKSIEPDGSSSTFNYDSQGNLVGIENAAGEKLLLTYDQRGNVESVTGPDGKTSHFTYDNSGNRTSMTDAGGNRTSYEYNSNAQLTKVVDASGVETLYRYDSAGNRSSVTDANGKTTTFEYNFEGQMTRMIDAMGHVTSFDYGGTAGCSSCGGGVDKLTRLSDAKGQATLFQYDVLGNLIQETDPLGHQTRYAYDAAGRISSRTDPNGHTINYHYDTLGRLTAKTYPDGTQATFGYDIEGNLLTATNNQIAYTFAYDVKDRLTNVSDSRGHRIEYLYDVAGRRTALRASNGISINYGYDDAGRLSALQSAAGNITFDYDGLGRRSFLQFPNGVTTSYQYDLLGRLTDQITTTGSSMVIENHYTHDAVGNRLSNQDPRSTTDYTYDDIYRLIEAKVGAPGQKIVKGKRRGKWDASGSAAKSQKEFYQYDPVGNRITSSEHNSYSHNGNELIAADETTYTYDANGNRTSKKTPKGTTTYLWDYENRLVQVVKPCGSTIAYAYDPFGRRIEKTVNGKTTNYAYDSEDILFETVNGEAGNIYIHGPGIDEPLALLGKKGAAYYHADGLGSIVAMTDDQARNVQQYEYDSFGNLHDMKNRIKQPYGYTGREHDRETGMWYYRARYYDGEVGRFISRDPIGFAGGFNLYAYVNGRVINLTDPYGKTPVYGYWCGPDWTGGFEAPWDELTPNQQSKVTGPLNDLDKCCETHDKCFAKCREDNPCDEDKKDECFNRCHSELNICASNCNTDGIADFLIETGMWWLK